MAGSLEFLLPGDPMTATGGYAYDREILDQLSALGWQVRLHRLDAGFPLPDPTARAAAASVLAGLASNATVVIDGLALGALPDELHAHAARLRLVALIHHPLALETGLAPALAQRLASQERRALAAVRRVIVTSESTAALLAGYGVAPARLAVVRPGTQRRVRARGGTDGTLQLLCVGSVVPRKGHAVLVRSLAGLRDRAWQLRCVGSLARDPLTVQSLRRLIAATDLEQRVLLLGELDDRALTVCYASADAFVLASYMEGYGMALAEALASGLPIISTRAGAIAQTVPPQAGLLVEPGDEAALGQALARVMDDSGLRARLGEGAWQAGQRLYGWRDAGLLFARELERARAPGVDLK